VTVGQRFDRFLNNINLTDDQVANGKSRRQAVTKTLNAKYWNSTSNTANSHYVGSWAKLTRVRPPRDVDILFELPKSVYDRFQLRTGNKQSQLLQEVRTTLAAAYPNTAIRGDGPIVLVPFASFNVEVIPAFSLNTGGHWVCMTDGGGHYKTAKYSAEVDLIATSSSASANNTRPIIRMMKVWQRVCSVPLKSFHIELVAVSFLSQWQYREKSSTWYDWMVRDFLQYLVNRVNGSVYAPGTSEIMSLGSAWESKAKTALERAKKACTYEANSDALNAGDEWQKIFGTDMPRQA
jgi:hypothetical protein